MQRGQVAIEFIFILLIIVVYIFTVTMPLIQSTESAIIDIEKIGKIKNEADKLNQTINKINLFGDGSKETINVFIPAQTQINCDETNNRISFTAQINRTQINPTIANCNNDICNYEYDQFQNLTLDCVEDVFVSGNYKIEILKADGNIRLRIVLD